MLHNRLQKLKNTKNTKPFKFVKEEPQDGGEYFVSQKKPSRPRGSRTRYLFPSLTLARLMPAGTVSSRFFCGVSLLQPSQLGRVPHVLRPLLFPPHSFHHMYMAALNTLRSLAHQLCQPHPPTSNNNDVSNRR
jgi:hypothetical protein